MDTTNLHPNDETAARVRADRHRARKIGKRAWLDWLETELERALAADRASEDERRALDTELKRPGSEPQTILAREFARREVPYFVATTLAAWVVRQRRATGAIEVAAIEVAA